MVMLVSHRLEPGVWPVIALYVAAGLVGLTRMYVGAYYPRDVLGGVVLGSTWGLVAMLVDSSYWLSLRF